MIEDKTFSSQESLELSSLPSFSSFDFTWDSMLEYDAVSSCVVKDEETFDVSSAPTGLPFDQTSVMCNEISSDYPVLQSGMDELLSPAGPSHSTEVTPVASLIATNNWPGECGFNIHFDEIRQQSSKGANWIYSSKQDKLYVKKDASCPIKFETNQYIPHGAIIRTMAVFEDARYAHEIVQRCYNHFRQDSEKGILSAEHLVKCECDQASYERDSVTNRLSVSVQYENPQSGENYTTYIFKFTCLGSCSGGINRRSVKVIFTLEFGGKVIGRRSLGVRICACPRRDIVSDERKLVSTKEENESTRKRKGKHPKSDDDENCTLSFLNFVGKQPCKKAKRNVPSNGPYFVTTNDRDQYLFLKQMQNLYLMYDASKKGLLHRQSVHSLAGSSDSSYEEIQETDESDS